LLLVKVVREEEVWKTTYGKFGKAWEKIAELFAASIDLPASARRPDSRACQDRYNVLYERRKKLDRQPEVRSGSSEDFDDLDQLLYLCVEETEHQKSRTEEEKKKEKDGKDERERTQERLRTHTRQTYSPRRNPSRPPNDSSSSSASPLNSEENSHSEREGDEGHRKKVKPSVKIQQELLVSHKEGIRLISAQLDKLVAVAEMQGLESRRSNDLFERIFGPK
jgi:hypothetical protein